MAGEHLFHNPLDNEPLAVYHAAFLVSSGILGIKTHTPEFMKSQFIILGRLPYVISFVTNYRWWVEVIISMETEMTFKIVSTLARMGKSVTLSVNGKSMLPSIAEKDMVEIQQFDNYNIGDVLVYMYKGDLLIHRLVKKENERFVCKGDNSFRLEDIFSQDIIGKVISVNGSHMVPLADNVVTLSYYIGRLFRKTKYNIFETTQSGAYMLYYEKIRGKTDSKFLYKKKPQIRNVCLEDYDLGDGIPNYPLWEKMSGEILDCLKDSSNMDKIITHLCASNIAEKRVIYAEVDNVIARMILLELVEVYSPRSSQQYTVTDNMQ